MRPYLIIYLITYSFIFMLPALAPLRFLENDDTVMMLLASGIYDGSPSANLVFINYYIGLILSTLYTVQPAVGWYEYMMLGVLASVLAALFCVAFARWRDDRAAGLVLLGILLLLMASSLAHINFTTVAAFATATGAWLVLRTRSVPALLVGLFLCLMGGMLRFEAAGLVLLLSAPFLALVLHQGHLRWRNLAVFGVAVLAMVALEIAGDRAYRAMDAEYVAYNEVRGQINDNPNLDQIRESLPDGISENDLFLIRTFFYDSTHVKTEKLEALRAVLSEKESSFGLQRWIAELGTVLSNPYVSVIVLGLLVLALTQRDRRVTVYFTASIILLLSVLTFIDLHATLKPRVVRSALIALLIGLFFLNLPRPATRWGNIALAVPLLLLAGAFANSTQKRIFVTLNGQEAYQQQLELMQGWDGPVVVYRSDFHMQNALLFDEQLREAGRQMVVSGWLTRHPENAAFTDFRFLLAPEVALLVTSRENFSEFIQNAILTSLQENYGMNATVGQIAQGEHGRLVVFRRLEPN